MSSLLFPRVDSESTAWVRHRKGVKTVVAGGALAVFLAVSALGAPVISARTPAVDISTQVQRTLDMQVSSESGWSGAIQVGSEGRIDGQRRSWRGMPVTLSLTRQSCDISGCLTTEISTTRDRPVLGMAHVGAGLSKATLAAQTIPVRVTTTHRGRVLGDSTALLTVSVRGRSQGGTQRETSVVDGLWRHDRHWASGQGAVTIIGEDGELLTLESSRALIQVTRIDVPRER